MVNCWLYTCNTYYRIILPYYTSRYSTHRHCRLPSFFGEFVDIYNRHLFQSSVQPFSSPPPRFHDSPRQVSHSQISTFFYGTPFSFYQLLVCLTCQFISHSSFLGCRIVQFMRMAAQPSANYLRTSNELYKPRKK